MEKVIIRDGKGKDWISIKEIQKKVWIETYHNEELGISREAIERGFKERAARAKETVGERAKKFGPTEDSHW
jgi:hypothetical protein